MGKGDTSFLCGKGLHSSKVLRSSQIPQKLSR